MRTRSARRTSSSSSRCSAAACATPGGTTRHGRRTGSPCSRGARTTTSTWRPRWPRRPSSSSTRRVRLAPAMPYDEDLANRLRELLADEDGITEKKMFGGLAFLLNGHMSVSASGKGGLLVRLDPAEADKALEREHVERMEMGGRSMDGWLRVAPEGLNTKRQLEPWVKRSVRFVRTLPPK